MHLKRVDVNLNRFESVPIDSDAEEAAEFLAIKVANQSSEIAAEVVRWVVLVMQTLHVTDADDAMGTCTEMACRSDNYNLAEELVATGKCLT